MSIHVLRARRRVAIGVLTLGSAVCAVAPATAVPGAAGQAPPGPPEVTVTELLPPEGSPPETILLPLDINDHGQVVGAAYQGFVGSASRPFLWEDGQISWLPTPDEDELTYRAEHINDRGEVLVESPAGSYRWFAGEVTDLRSSDEEYVTTADLNERGQALITRSTGMGGREASAWGVWDDGSFTPIAAGEEWSMWFIDRAVLSDAGHVAGTLRPWNPTGLAGNDAFVWHGGALTLLGDREGVLVSNGAWGINSHGHVVGHDGVAGQQGGTLWRDGRAIRLGFRPDDINERGQVVGTNYSGSTTRTYRWEDGRATTLRSLGGDHSSATAVNERGQAVGDSRTSDGTYHYAFWTGGRVLDLGAAGPYPSDPRPLLLNDEGQVAGQLPTADGGVRTVVWTVGGGSGDPGSADCITATNAAHVEAGRATSWLRFAWAVGSDQYLGATSETSSLRQTAPGRWESVGSC